VLLFESFTTYLPHLIVPADGEAVFQDNLNLYNFACLSFYYIFSAVTFLIA